jgi:hypothetical protein
MKYLCDVASSVTRDSKPEAAVWAHIPIGAVYPALTNSAAKKQVNHEKEKVECKLTCQLTSHK